ncbi:hypothetical protein Adt_42491 [Abeliophyllum distichum]|uniref:Uncharacterized protein n=1 Tax=Abeliophyllum distichum TaxID=126358 RepID=A0ABD1PRT2_9LAMI
MLKLRWNPQILEMKTVWNKGYNLNLPYNVSENVEERGENHTDYATLPLYEYQLTRDRQRRQIRPPARYADESFVSLLTCREVVSNEHYTYEEALNSKDLENFNG